ncbi:MAG: glycerophosphodiester phosphodiesterase [Candidatus Hodarchaeota archaeon]
MDSSEKNVLIIAHRGASNLATENTLNAFQKAIKLGADYIEFDVHQLKDGKIVIMHDANTFRMTGQKRTLKEITYEELKRLEIGDGERIPTLHELINIAKGKIALNCEVKARGLAEILVRIFQQADIIESTIISSFKNDILLKIQNIEPRVRLAALRPIRMQWIKSLIFPKKILKTAVKNGFYAVGPKHIFVNRKFIDRAHHHGIKVFTWTVDSEKKIRKLIKIGVDGIITNNISNMKKILNQLN